MMNLSIFKIVMSLLLREIFIMTSQISLQLKSYLFDPVYK